MDSHEWICFVLRVSMNNSQLEFSWATHFLTHQPKIVTNTITPTWITSIQSNTIATSILSINFGWTSPKQRFGNIHISDLPEFTEADLSDNELWLFHQTFQALQVTTPTDIVDASGKYIHMSFFQCTAAIPSPYRWPIRKTTITRQHKEVWQSVLCRISSHMKSMCLPLGICLVAPNMTLPFHHTECGLIHIQSSELWHLYLPVQKISQRWKRNHSEVYHSEFEVV